MVPTGAKQLTYLRIMFFSSPRDPTSESGILKRLVQCIAQLCRLQRLDVVARSTKPKVLNGDPLLSHILPLHGRTLKILKLPNHHITRVKLGQLFSQCDRLTALWLGIPPELKVRIPFPVLIRCQHISRLAFPNYSQSQPLLRSFASTLTGHGGSCMHKVCCVRRVRLSEDSKSAV
jgi:hypothetical protein